MLDRAPRQCAGRSRLVDFGVFQGRIANPHSVAHLARFMHRVPIRYVMRFYVPYLNFPTDVGETDYTPFESTPYAATVGVNGGGKVCHVGGSIVGLRLSFLASWPVDLAKSRTGRGLTTATGNAAAATAATKGSSKPPVASSITAGRLQYLQLGNQCLHSRFVV